MADWKLKGTVVVACNCDYGCPCNFNALPTNGKCEGGWIWHVEEGSFGDTSLDGLTFSVLVNWPGAIHQGNGEGLILVDERADDAQREAMETLLSGEVGGPWGILAWTWPTVHGPKPVAFELDLNGIHSRVKAGDSLEVESTTIKNPVTGEDHRVRIDLPDGFEYKQAEIGNTVKARIAAEEPLSFTLENTYAQLNPFDWTNAA